MKASAAGQGKGGIGQGENLWNSILQDVVKRDEVNTDSHLLLLGNMGSGKRSVVREINNKFV